MDLIPEPRTICLVKVIVNPRAEESFTIKWALYPVRKVNVKIITPNVQQLKSIVNEMKKELSPARYAFRVQFNWKNVPQEIQKDGTFKKDIFKLFQNAPAIDEFVTPASFKSPKVEFESEMVESFVSHIRTHITNFGAHPDLALRTPKGIKKIHNYVKTVCGKHDMTEEEALTIANNV
jgi:hypothetical protein